jgi:hypothetical protein
MISVPKLNVIGGPREPAGAGASDGEDETAQLIPRRKVRRGHGQTPEGGRDAPLANGPERAQLLASRACTACQRRGKRGGQWQSLLGCSLQRRHANASAVAPLPARRLDAMLTHMRSAQCTTPGRHRHVLRQPSACRPRQGHSCSVRAQHGQLHHGCWRAGIPLLLQEQRRTARDAGDAHHCHCHPRVVPAAATRSTPVRAAHVPAGVRGGVRRVGGGARGLLGCWLVGWLVLLVGWLVGWLVGFAGWLVDWLIDGGYMGWGAA